MKRRINLPNLFPVFTLFILLLCSTSAFAINAKREVLRNGLTVLFYERHNLPIVKVKLLIRASKLDEPSEKAGLANLTASMLTEGTKNRTSRQISEEIEFMGADLGVSSTNDYTTLALSILKKDIEKGFEIFSDILLNPIFPEVEIKQKKEWIKGSLKQSEESPSFLATRAFIKEIFGGHPYGRLTEGSPASIESLTRDDLIHFHRDHYLPSESILSVVGDLSYDELMSFMDRYLKTWRNNNRKRHGRSDVNQPHKKKIITIDKDLTQATIILGHRGIKRDNPDYYRVSVMNYIFGGGGFSSRLMQKIRDDMGLAYDVHSFFSSHKYGGSFRVAVQTKNEAANTVIAEIVKEMKRMKEKQVREQDLHDAKTFLRGSFPRRLDTMSKIANFLAGVEFYKLGLDYDEKYMDYINDVTLEDVKRVAKKYLDDKNHILVVVGDLKKAKIKGGKE